MHPWLPANTITDAKPAPFSEITALIGEEAITPSTEALAKQSGEKHILIVDDDPIVLMLVSKMVLKLGYHPKTAADGMDALLCLDQSEFNLIITDYDIPLLNGLELAAQIKKRLVKIPVILMTGNHDNGLLSDIETSGLVAGLLLKPFNLTTLREKIETVTHHGPARGVS
jgi:CheY-like chemotaxis protein